MLPRRPTVQQLDAITRERDRELMYTHAQRTGYRDPVVWFLSQLADDGSGDPQQLHQPLTRGPQAPGGRTSSDEVLVYHHNHIFRQWKLDWTAGTRLHVTLVDCAEQAGLLAAGDAAVVTHAVIPEVSQRDIVAAPSHSNWHTHAYTEQRRAGAVPTAGSKVTVVQAAAGKWVFEFHQVGRPTATVPPVHALQLKVARRRLSAEELQQEQRRRQSDSLTIREAAERASEARRARDLRAHSAASTVMSAARASSSSRSHADGDTPTPPPPAAAAAERQPGELKRSAKRALPVAVAPAPTPTSPAAKRRRATPRSEVDPAPVLPPAPAIYVPVPFVPTAQSELVEEF